MKKTNLISEFLDYGGNELFSAIMTDNLKRSEGIDRLTELLKAYSDRCRRIKGRSAAYRYMISQAAKNGWLGRDSADLHSHRLSGDERTRVEESVGKYISSGGAKKKAFISLLLALSLVAVLSLSVYLIWRKMSSEKYQKQMSEFYSSQVIIEYVWQTAEGFDFVISTTDNISEFVYMEHMPRLFYLTADTETEKNILPENDIHEIVTKHGADTEYAQDPRSVFSANKTHLCLKEEDYGKTFFPGKYRVEFDFYFYSTKGDRVEIPTVAEEVTVR